MKVVAINGSPRAEGNTYQSLAIMAERLKEKGIEVEILQLGTGEISGCIACLGCTKTKDERCILRNGPVNEYIQKVKEADGIILGSPVYFSGINGGMKSLLDRMFYASAANGGLFRNKVAASVVAVRRSGGVNAFNQLNHYLLYQEMLVVSANYWNVIHGRAPGEIEQDLEGVHTLTVLADNMAWALKLIEHGKGTIEAPSKPNKVFTHFVR